MTYISDLSFLLFQMCLYFTDVPTLPDVSKKLPVYTQDINELP